MVYLWNRVGGNAMRGCYQHPDYPNKCVKVVRRAKDLPELKRELAIVRLPLPYLREFLPKYENVLITTNLGPGLICDLIRNEDDNSISQPLTHFHGCVEYGDDIETDLREILRRLIGNNLFFFDFNSGNFLVKRLRDGRKKVFFTDLKSFHRTAYKGFWHLERWIAPLARNVMFRRMRHLYEELGLSDFPLKKLCRKKMFSSFWIDIRL